MNGILGMIELVLDSPLEPDQREQLVTAQRSALTLLAILNDILDLSKIESGHLQLEQIPFSIRGHLRECVRPHQIKARQNGVDLRLRLDDSVPEMLEGDPLRLRQILNNLIGNAVKFTTSGHIDVQVNAEPAAEPDSATLIISVRDTGTGIPADKLPQIFDKFTQADGSISRKFGGTGLGLAITKNLVELFRGTLSVSSQVGRGSEFLARLPFAVSVSAPASEAEPSREQPATDANALVLIVEDNFVNQKVIRGLLQRKGYRMETATNGSQALAMLEQYEFKAILMDVQMPVMDGLEATRRIRATERWRNIPIIAMTAHAMNGDQERCLAAGMDAYLSKPVNSADLYQVLDSFVGTSAPSRRKAPNPLEPAPIDPRLHDQLCEGPPQMVGDMVNLFLQLAQERLDRLQAAVTSGELRSVSTEALTIQASARRIAANPVADRARRIADAAERGDAAAMRHSLLLLRSELDRLRRHAGELRVETAS